MKASSLVVLAGASTAAAAEDVCAGPETLALITAASLTSPLPVGYVEAFIGLGSAIEAKRGYMEHRKFGS